MGGLLSAISGQFAKAIILGTLFPVIILSALNIFVVAPLLPQTASLPVQLLKIAVGDDKWGAVILTFIVLLIIGLLYNLNIPIIRLYEGYPWAKSIIGKYFARQETRRFTEASDLRSAVSWLGPKLALAAPNDPLVSDLQKHQAGLSLLLNSDLPDSKDFILPTRLGNVIRCFERYPFLAYGIEAIVLWPRLLAKIDAGFASTIDEAKASFDFMLNTSFLSGLTACGILVIGLGKPSALTWHDYGPWLWRAALFMVSARVFYWLSISRASEWGGQVRSAFDLYRFDLLKQMGFVRRPMTNGEEKTLWGEIAGQMLYPTNRNLLIPYEEPSTRLIPYPPDIQLTARRRYGAQQPNLRIPVALVLTNPDTTRPVSSLVVIEPVPDGYKYVPDSASVAAGVVLNVARISPLEFYLGPVPQNFTVTIRYAIKPT
jgi:hypothetical protein